MGHATFAGTLKASTPNRTTQGWFEDLAHDRFIIGDKASVTDEIAGIASTPMLQRNLVCAGSLTASLGAPRLLVVTMTPPS